MTIKNGEIANAEDVIESIGRLTTRIAYNGVNIDSTNWENTDCFAADNTNLNYTGNWGPRSSKNTILFNSFSNVANLINHAYSTSSPVSDYVTLRVIDTISSETTYNPDGFTNPDNAFDGDDDTYASKVVSANTSASLGKTFSSTTKKYVFFRWGFFQDTSYWGSTVKMELQTYDGSTWTTRKTHSFMDAGWHAIKAFSGILDLSSAGPISGIRFRFTNTAGSYSYDMAFYAYTLEAGNNFPSSGTLETNTILSDVVPQSMFVYGKADLPTNTNITVDISDDGGSTWAITNQPLDTAIDTSSLTGTDIRLRFNLSTTDNTVTPKLYGYAVAVTDV